MEDTTPEIKRKIFEMIQLKTPSERCKMGCSMIETSKYLIISSLIREQPDITQNELRAKLFLKFYQDDFSLEQQEKIVNHLLNVKINQILGYTQTH